MSSSDHAIFTWNYQTYKSILAVETADVLMDTQHRMFFERLTQVFDTLFDYTLQEGAKLNL